MFIVMTHVHLDEVDAEGTEATCFRPRVGKQMDWLLVLLLLCNEVNKTIFLLF